MDPCSPHRGLRRRAIDGRKKIGAAAAPAFFLSRLARALRFEREMWIAKNGSLVYWSKKEDRCDPRCTRRNFVLCSRFPGS